jgi:hypothetical protein
MVHRSAGMVPSLRRLAGAAVVAVVPLMGGCYVAVGVNGAIVGGIEIHDQPDDQTVRAGQSARFAVGVVGSGPLRYQWLRDDDAIAGATNPAYQTAPTVPADSGANFAVRVCNDHICVRSDTAVLTVAP